MWFQVTDFSLYAAVDKNNTYIWVNDLSSGSPVPGATIQLWGTDTSTLTDDKGLARLATPEDNLAGVYATVSKDHQEAIATIFPWSQWDSQWETRREFASGYWKYLYLDRTLYKPNDTVHFWGLIKPRSENAKPLDKVTVALLSTESRDNSIIDSKEIDLEGISFTDNIKLPNLTPGYYYLEVKSGDYVISSQDFQVETYSKPAYQLEIIPSKKAVYVGDKIDFEVKATFFEGTPAAYVPLDYYIQDYGNGSIATDDEGNAKISYSPKFDQEHFSSVRSPWLFLTAKLPESGEITNEASFVVLNNDISIDAEDMVEGSMAKVEIDISRLTVDKVNSGQVEPWAKDAYKSGPATNHPVNYKIYRETWEKQEDGKYYDFINKKVETRYIYQYKKVFESEGQVTTNQEGKAVFTFPVENKESYLVELVAQDFKGNPATTNIGFRPGFCRDYGYTWYHLEGKDYYKSGEEVKLL